MRLLAPVFVFMLGVMVIYAHGQSFGGNPSSTKWRQVNNAAVKVIYPKGLDSVAGRVATISEWLLQNNDQTIGKKHRKISVVLQPDVTYSNAYVGLGPYRSEFYMMPPQNPFELGSINWADNLAIHEFRHAQQYSNYNRGLSKFMRVIAGENGQALANSMAVPDWFFEGDAVWSETKYTAQGRGRLPSGFNPYRSLQLASKNYNYMKLRNGSLRKFVPNHYDLGFLLVSYGRETWGDSIWQAVTEDAAAFKKLFYPLQGALEKRTGVAYKTFINNALQDFRKRSELTKVPDPAWITRSSEKYVVNYKYPYATEDGNIIALKSGYRQIPQFVQVDKQGRETKIAVKDIGYDDYFSYRNNRIVYSALKTDARWGNRDYSIIRLLDVKTKSAYNITTTGRFFSPDIMDNGERIVAVRVDRFGKSVLVQMNTEGEVLESFTPDSSYFFSHPRFLQDGTNAVVAAVRNAQGQMGWLIWNGGGTTWRWLMQPADRLLGFPMVQGDTLLYTATEGKYDALYSVSISGGQRYQVQVYPTGVYQGVMVNGQLIASYFTAFGYRLGSSPLAMQPLLPETAGFTPLYSTGSNGAMPPKAFPAAVASEKYKKGFHPINIHSWQPEITQSEYTFRVLGNNVLNTTSTQLYYTYNVNEKSNAVGGSFVFGGWYVQPLVQGKQTWGREVEYNQDTTFLYNETEVGAGLQLPLNLTRGRRYRSLVLSSTFNTDRVKWTGIGKGLLQDQDFNYLRTRLYYVSQIQQARQHIYPRLAHALLLDYRNVLESEGPWQFLASGSLYLPGFHVNHNIVLTAAFQGRDTLGVYQFSNNFPFSRGYEAINFPRLWRFGANYHLPLFYPDWGFGQILYFLRVRANVFYDYTQGKSLRTGLTYPFSTVGGEVYFDTRWWNQLPVSIGVRYIRLLDQQLTAPTQPNQWEVILPINLL